MRAYNIKLNGKVIQTVGGSRAGQFAPTTPSKRVYSRKPVRLHNRPLLISQHIKRLIRALKYGVIVTFMIAMLCYGFQIGIKKEDLNVEAQTNQISTVGDFESKEMPAYTDEYDYYFGAKADEARKIAQCESGDRDIVSKINYNGTYDIGRMQINSLWLKVYNLTEKDLLNKDTNIKVAKAIYDRTNSWSAWYSSKKCHGLE